MPKFQQRHIIAFGVACVIFFWCLDAIVDALIFHEASLVEQLISPPGHEIWLRVLFSFLLAVFTACVCLIIGQRDRLEAELAAALTLAAEEKAKSSAIIAAIGDGISIQDLQMKVLYQNRVHKELAGGDFAGEFCYRVYDRRETPCTECPVMQAFADGKVHKLVKTSPGGAASHIEITASPLRDGTGKNRQIIQNPGVQTYESVLFCGNGELRDAIFKKATYVDGDGAIAGIVCVVVDITERKMAETAIRDLNEDLARKAADLEAANRELESFSYSVTHDLRKPLTIIYTAAQALRDECRIEGDETAAYFIQTICEGSRRMEELIEALQILTHVSRSEMVVATVDLSQLVEEIFADLRLMAPERNIELKIAPGITAVGDPRLLRVMLENLLGNAWKYTGKCREARIGFGVAQTPVGEAYFVRDNGTGFDMARVGELFKPFVRLPNAREFPGTGVGLATVYRIVERHGGRVWAESAARSGATFYFTLPEPYDLFDERSAA
ncbi:PAS domain-containing sensor histidine kinase [Geobacter argillaceus]|uniref:histidine kinase n=1 Tax=Geobacter argillaceus TaxID=345631 RepID=A0A562VIL1_9BACT|nr:PAS domain-containing sensor histidine kinase [Geobacter argillaceus]TWJ17739.1 hypothetical protein JN12_02856 [Geobacter argillaceus]